MDRLYGEEVSARILSLTIEERSGIIRANEPVTVGIPLPRGNVFHPAELYLLDPQNRLTPLQAQVLARWADESIKWALLDFQANVGAKEVVQYQLGRMIELAAPVEHKGITVEHFLSTITVRTGSIVFLVNTKVFRPFDRVIVDGVELLEDGSSRTVLTDQVGAEYEPRIHHVAVETEGPLRVTLNMRGNLCDPQNSAIADFIARLSFYAQSNVVELKFTVRNPKAARHSGGFWDLGDEGSIYFRDLSIHTILAAETQTEVEWTTHPSRPVERNACSRLEIYQDSSGGRNWQSSNHVNRFGKVTTTFPGYRVTVDGIVIMEGKRATPIISVRTPERKLSGTIDKFWQNFPKALEARHNRLSVRLFPHQCSDLHELQGGEQKTHTVFLQFGREHSLNWVQDRLIPRAAPKWYAESRAFPYLVPRNRHNGEETPLAQADDLVDKAIQGDNSFFDRREVIDEYGWRHFGDLYADHEAVCHNGHSPLVAHYNNQYDGIYGAAVQYARNGDVQWHHLMSDLAKHVVDIDIYHTQEDRSAFNGGLFWHTEHYTDVASATHRAYSKANRGTRNPHLCGGGPSNEHNYTTGLLYYYLLTGDVAAREAMMGLADWVIKMDDNSRYMLAFFDRRPTGLCSATVSRDYHGPGRGCGNSINALIDAYIVTREQKYIGKAEQLIRRCIHPKDNIQTRNLFDVEHRWSYTVFLQVLGKYLDLKAEEGAVDEMYAYAQQSLLHYARWMLENEVPYKQVLDKVEIPTETWPAQDIRKSNVFKFAAKHAQEPLRGKFLRKSTFFFEACVRDLLSFDTCTLTRPVVLMMTNAFMHAYFQVYPDESAPSSENSHNFGFPKRFVPQLYELYKVREKLFMLRTIIHSSRFC